MNLTATRPRRRSTARLAAGVHPEMKLGSYFCIWEYSRAVSKPRRAGALPRMREIKGAQFFRPHSNQRRKYLSLLIERRHVCRRRCAKHRARTPLEPRPTVGRANRFYWPRITREEKRAAREWARRGIYDTRSCAAEQLRSCLASAARWLRSSVDRAASRTGLGARIAAAGGPPGFGEDAWGHSSYTVASGKWRALQRPPS